MALSPLGIALMMQQPTPAPNPGKVAPTDVQGAFNASTQEANTQYQAKLAQQNALWGGLAGLGGAGIIGASKIPAIQNAVGSWLGGGAGAGSSDLASGASTVGNWLSDPAFSSLLPASMGGGSASTLAPGAAAATGWAPTAAGAADAGATGAADAGSVAAADAAGTAAAGAGAADAGAFSVADLLPFLFAV